MSAWPTAVEVLREMKGSSNSYLIQASNRQFYIIKHSRGEFRERLLVNELFAAELARCIGLPVPAACPIVVPASLVRAGSAEHLSPPWAPGVHCASEFAAPPFRPVYDYFPRALLHRVTNLDAVAGCWIFDVWTGNADETQAVFCAGGQVGRYVFSKIDHGWCFSAGDWIPRDLRREVLRWQKPVLAGKAFATSLFSPYFERIQSLSRDQIAACAAAVPAGWLTRDLDREEFDQLVSLLARRAAHLDEHARACWPFVSCHRVAAMATR